VTKLALFIPEHTPDGIFYHPANKVAIDACKAVKRCIIPESVLPQLRALGYDLAETNGTPIGRVDVVA
jgi:hypothetical protein